MRLPRTFLVLVFLSAPAAQAQIRHCTTPAGFDLYTDRRCEELGAAPARVAPAAPVGATYRAGCARSLRDLVFAVQTAIDQGDPNRLADSYLWDGQSTQSGYALLDRLSSIARRPLAEIVPVYAGDDDAALFPQDTTTRAPVALRLEQTPPGGMTRISTVLALRQSRGCWWVSF